MRKTPGPDLQSSKDLQSQLQQLDAQIEKLTSDRAGVQQLLADTNNKLDTDFNLPLEETTKLVEQKRNATDTLKELDRQLTELGKRRDGLEQEIAHRARLEAIAKLKAQIDNHTPGLTERMQRINELSSELLSQLRDLYAANLPVHELVAQLRSLDDTSAKVFIQFGNRLALPVAAKLEPGQLGFEEAQWAVYLQGHHWWELTPEEQRRLAVPHELPLPGTQQAS